MTESAKDRQRLLRAALLGNAAFSAWSGMVILFWRTALFEWALYSQTSGTWGLFLGVSLVVFATWVLLTGCQKPIKLQSARAAVTLDLAWVAVSIPVVVMAPLTSEGKLGLTTIAVIVLCFAIAQWLGIQRINSETPKTTSRLR